MSESLAWKDRGGIATRDLEITRVDVHPPGHWLTLSLCYCIFDSLLSHPSRSLVYHSLTGGKHDALVSPTDKTQAQSSGTSKLYWSYALTEPLTQVEPIDAPQSESWQKARHRNRSSATIYDYPHPIAIAIAVALSPLQMSCPTPACHRT